MILDTQPVEIDLVHLLLHEPNNLVYHPYDQVYLADAINKRFDQAVTTDNPLRYLKFVPPTDTGLSRWRLEWWYWNKDEPETYTADRGVRRAGDVRKALPYEVVTLLRAAQAWRVMVLAEGAKVARPGPRRIQKPK